MPGRGGWRLDGGRAGPGIIRLEAAKEREQTIPGFEASRAPLGLSRPREDLLLHRQVGLPCGRRPNRPFAFRSIWPKIRERLENKPNLNASELFDQLRTEFPGRYTPGQANALGRLVREWRIEAAARGLAVRPLCFRKYGKPRYWRTRIDPLEQVWSEMCVSLEADPDQTSKELLAEFQARYPSKYDRQLRTLQRRVQAWRKQAVSRLVFGVADQSLAITGSTESRGGEDGG